MALIRIGSLNVTKEETNGETHIRFTIPTVHSSAALTLEQTDTLLERLRKEVTKLKRRRKQ